MLFLRSKSFRKKRLAWNCPDYVILLYYWRVQGASSLSYFFLLCRFHLRRTFVNSIKLPAMILSWKNLQEVFLMLVIVVVLPHWKFLRARATFPCYQHSTLVSQAREGLHSSELYPGYFRLLYFCQAFPSQLYRERYGFEWVLFTYSRFLPCTPYPHFVTILWLRCWQEHPIQDPPLACPHKVDRRGWRLKDGLELLIL